MGRNRWDAYWFGRPECTKDPKRERRIAWFSFFFFSTMCVDSVLLSAEYGSHSELDGHLEIEFYRAKILDEDWWNAISPNRNELCRKLFGLCAVFAAFASIRVLHPLSTAMVGFLWTVAYFSTMLDGFQHHYMICLVASVAAFFDENRKWPVCLILIQMSITYLFAVVHKLADPNFLAGSYLPKLAMNGWVHTLVTRWSDIAGIPEYAIWITMALYTAACEAILCVALPVIMLEPRSQSLSSTNNNELLRWTCFALGVTLHAGIQFAGSLYISFFSWYMFSMYLLVIP